MPKYCEVCELEYQETEESCPNCRETIKEYEKSMLDASTLDQVSANLARELLFHWIHQMDSKSGSYYNPQAREKLTLICRGAHQVPGHHFIEAEFTTELENVVYARLWEMWEFVMKNWPEE